MSNFCVINTEDSLLWSPVHFFEMFSAILRKESEHEWRVINIANGEALPDDIHDYKGIVITGSHYNTRDRDTIPWFDSLCNFIQKAAEVGSPKIYGGCFGCQIIAVALGGQVDYNPAKQFALKAEKIQLFQPLFSELLVQDKNISTEHSSVDNLNIIVSHAECVTVLPPDAHHIATSDSCVHEMFVCGPKKSIICAQAHPEFMDVKYAIYDRIAPVVIDERKRLNDEQKAESFESFAEYEKNDAKDARYFMSLVSDFLHN